MVQVKSYRHKVHKRLFLTKKFYFILFQLFFSLDFGFIEYKSSKTKFWSKLFIFVLSLCHSIPILVILFTSTDNYYQTWGVKAFLECYLYILILLFTPDDSTLCTYQRDLQYFDNQIGVESYIRLDKMILLFWLLSSLFDILLMCLCYIFRVDDYRTLIFLQALFYIPRRTYNFPLVVLFFVFYSAFYRLQKLKIYVKNRKFSIIHSQLLYKFLIDSVENVLKTFKYIFFSNLILNIPGIMASIYTLLKAIREKDEINLQIITPYIDLIQTMIVKLIPTLSATWLLQEALNVKLILQNRLLEESGILDKNQTQAMERFIKYVEARPFKFFMLSFIPMDTGILVIVLNFCISYLIVILQLTHIY